MSIGMTTQDPIAWVERQFGGRIYPMQGAYAQQWFVTGAQCQPVLEAVLPYLILKTQQAVLALAYCATIRPRHNRKKLTDAERKIKQQISEAMCLLNTRKVNV
jgi:hypothetical protein